MAWYLPRRKCVHYTKSGRIRDWSYRCALGWILATKKQLLWVISTHILISYNPPMSEAHKRILAWFVLFVDNRVFANNHKFSGDVGNLRSTAGRDRSDLLVTVWATTRYDGLCWGSCRNFVWLELTLLTLSILFSGFWCGFLVSFPFVSFCWLDGLAFVAGAGRAQEASVHVYTVGISGMNGYGRKGTIGSNPWLALVGTGWTVVGPLPVTVAALEGNAARGWTFWFWTLTRVRKQQSNKRKQ